MDSNNTPVRYSLKVLWRVLVSVCYGVAISVVLLIVVLRSSANLEVTPGYLRAKLEIGMSFEEVRGALGFSPSVEPIVDGDLRIVEGGLRYWISDAPSIDLVFQHGALQEIQVIRRQGISQSKSQLNLRKRDVQKEGES